MSEQELRILLLENICSIWFLQSWLMIVRLIASSEIAVMES